MRTYIILSTLYFIYLNNVIDDPPVDFHKKEKKKEENGKTNYISTENYNFLILFT